jgi:V/A-type H+/Na+-transporting ATPase subunit D
MTEQVLEGVKPTRMELLSIRKKLTLAEKGHNLLEQKRDSLVERFFSVIDKRNELVNDLDALFQQAFQSLIQSQMILGEEQVDRIARLAPRAGELHFTQDNIMGVKIPKMDDSSFSIPKEPSYGMAESCAKLDDSQQQFRDIMQKVLQLADLEGGIKSLAVEIEKTKRRVNVLENNLIPKLKATQKYIEMQLEEREREDFFRRKRIKAIMESKEE